MNTNESDVSVWAPRGGAAGGPSVVHVVALAGLTGIGIVLGTFGSIVVPLGFVSAFWPGQAVQSVGSIWFGCWGGIAAALFPLISNLLSGTAPLPVSLAYLPANFLQGMIPGWAFRLTKADPRLRGARDWAVWVIAGAVVPNLLGAAWGTTVLRGFGMITPQAHFVSFLGWFVGNTVPTLLLGSTILLYVSPLAVRHRSFVKGNWA